MNTAERWAALADQAEESEPIFEIKAMPFEHGPFVARVERTAAGLIVTFSGDLLARDVPSLVRWLQETFDG